MADNEMRIKIRVDQSQYMKAMQQMAKAQNQISNNFKSSGNSATGFGNAVASGMDVAGKSTKGSMKLWQSIPTAFGTITAAAGPVGIAAMVAGKAIQSTGKFVKESVMAYGDFEATLKQVQIITGGTQADFDLLSQKALELGANTSIGAQDVAEAEVEFAKLGFSAKDTAEAMTGVVYAAEASGSSVAETSQIVADSLNIWKMSAEQSVHVADVLAQTANVSAADMTDLGYTISYAGAAANQAGFSIEDLATMTAIMANNGIRGSKAGTSIRTAMTNLISPTDKAAEAMESLGIHLKDSEGKARPIPQVMKDVRTAFHNLSKEQQLDLATKIFGKPGAAGMVAYLRETQEGVDKMTQQMVESTGTAEAQAKKMRETLNGQLDQISDGFTTLKIKIGQAFTPLATEGAKGINKILDSVSEGFDGLMKKVDQFKVMNEVFDGIQLPTSWKAWFGETTTEVGRFADAFANMDSNMRTYQFGDVLSKQFWTAKSQMELVNQTFDSLDEKAKNFKFISPEQLTQLQTDTGNIVLSIQTMSGLIATEMAKYSADPTYNPSTAIAKAVEEGLPTLETSLNGQLVAVQTSHQNQLTNLQTFLSQSDMLDATQKANALAAQSTWNANQETLVSENNAKILSLYSTLGTQTAAERESSLLQIQSLEQQNSAIVQATTNATKDAILLTLQAQADSSGRITQAQKDKAIADANEQRDKSVSAAQEQYVQSVAAINSMSDEAVRATGHTRDELIANARQQASETITEANNMRDETVSAINDIEVKADNADGKKLTIKAFIEGAETVLGTISKIAAAAGNPIAFGVNVVTNAIKGATKARGGLTSGVGYGMGSGSATYSPNASAMGVGTQLGQGGVSQGVITNERGREVTMPVGNSTYMRPFARAIADELGQGGLGESQQEIIVPVYLNGRQFAIATNKDMSLEQNKYTELKNRARGK